MSSLRDSLRDIDPVVISKTLLVNGDGDGVETPDASFTITGAITLIAWVKLFDYSASSSPIIAKWEFATSNQRSFLFEIANNRLVLAISSTGANSLAAVSTAVLPTNDGDGVWIRATWNGSSSVSFYTSTEGSDTAYNEVTWTQLGTAVTLTTTGIFNGTLDLAVGAAFDITPGTYGYIKQAAIISGTVATATASNLMDPESDYVGGSSWTSSSSTGEVWTIQGDSIITLDLGD